MNGMTMADCWKIDRTEIQTQRYPISCKIYAPDSEAQGVILGVHGFAGDKESSALRKLAKAASKRNTALICFDFPAHGDSKAEEDAFTIENCIQDVLTMAEHIRQQYPNSKKFLFATSFGGFITLLCLKHLVDFQMVLRAPAVTMPEHILLDLLGATEEVFAKQGVITCGFERKIRLPYRFYQELKKHSVMEVPHDTPMLVIHGDRDDVVPHTDILRYCENHPSAKLCVIPGADHRFKKPGELEQVIDHTLHYWSLTE